MRLCGIPHNRKNWLFAGSPDGAKASAAFFSLIETAKANDLEPYGYLRHIFQNLPLAQTEQDLKDLLPQNIHPDTIAVIDQDYRLISSNPMAVTVKDSQWGLIDAYDIFVGAFFCLNRHKNGHNSHWVLI